MSETSKHRHLVARYCEGNGLDLGSAGDPIVPTAIQVDLPDPYGPLLSTKYPVQIRGSANNLIWFQNGCMDYVFSSHLIEDFNAQQQEVVIKEWTRVLKPGGYLVLLAPEKHRWQAALDRGQPPNCAHQHEPEVGEFTRLLKKMGGFKILEDRVCDKDNELEYSMMFVAQKE